jgi:hypothetical protein
MAETRVAQVIDALVTGMRATAGFRSPTSASTTAGLTTVYDGPEVWTTDDRDGQSLLVIGYSGSDPDEQTATAESSFTRGPIAVPARPRDEVSVIHCRAIADGRETPKIARDAALATIAAVSLFCRTDPSLGINTSDTVGGVRTIAFVTTGDLIQYLMRGHTAEWAFDVGFSTRV